MLSEAPDATPTPDKSTVKSGCAASFVAKETVAEYVASSVGEKNMFNIYSSAGATEKLSGTVKLKAGSVGASG